MTFVLSDKNALKRILTIFIFKYKSNKTIK